ncbi:hypothetical protein AAFN85_18895 [Mucilaginibacter sp. CAU 1740]|uniref:hypothetical protein n=1 Tax=Mucilaginibacter sp. CAU 1740 TaxID=3140365 RepID=UPI00325B687B
MKAFKKLILCFTLAILAFLYYVNRSSYITKYEWKYDGGSHIGDFLTFDTQSYFHLEGRTVFLGKKKIGELYLCIGYYMITKSEPSNKLGLYARKGNGN